MTTGIQDSRTGEAALARLSFACGIAHDCNHLLTVVRMQSALLFGDPRMPAELREGLRPIMDASERAAELNRQLLAIGGRPRATRRNLDLRRVAAELAPLLRRMAGERIAIVTDFAADLPAAAADRGMIERALLNLVANSRDAIAEQGRITLSLGAVVFSEEPRPGLAAGRYVCLAVTDSGCGIARENLARVFDPFFTTKPAGQGMGLGLATVQAVAEEHAGWVDVSSVEGKGTTFVLFVPAADRVTSP